MCICILVLYIAFYKQYFSNEKLENQKTVKLSYKVTQVVKIAINNSTWICAEVWAMIEAKSGLELLRTFFDLELCSLPITGFAITQSKHQEFDSSKVLHSQPVRRKIIDILRPFDGLISILIVKKLFWF